MAKLRHVIPAFFALLTPCMASTLWVTNGTSTIHLFDSATGTATGTITAPASITRIAAYNGNAYLLDIQNNNVYEYSAAGTETGLFVSGASSSQYDAEDIAFGPDGNLYISLGISNEVVEYSSTGSYIGVFGTGPSTGSHSLDGIAFGGGNVYVADFQGKRVLQYASAGGTPTVLATLSNSPDSLAFGNNGDLYATAAGAVYDVTTSSNLSNSGFSGTLRGLEFEGDGYAYVAGQGGSGVYRVSASGGTAAVFASLGSAVDFAFVATPEPGTVLLCLTCLALTPALRARRQ